jgi:hypothetical protein
VTRDEKKQTIFKHCHPDTGRVRTPCSILAYNTAMNSIYNLNANPITHLARRGRGVIEVCYRGFIDIQSAGWVHGVGSVREAKKL